MTSSKSEEGELVQDTWIRNCKVMIRLNGEPAQTKVIAITDIKDLDRYK